MTKKQTVKNNKQISSIYETEMDNLLFNYLANDNVRVYQDIVLQDITIWEKPIEWFWEILNPDVPRFIIATNNASALPPHPGAGGGTGAHEECCFRSEPYLVAIKGNIIRTNSPVRTQLNNFNTNQGSNYL